MFSDRSTVELLGFKLGETTIYTMIIVLIVTILCLLFRFLVFPKFKDKPEGFQNVMELCVETVEKFCVDATGKASRENDLRGKPAGLPLIYVIVFPFWQFVF